VSRSSKLGTYDPDADWEKACSKQIERETWIEVQHEWYLNHLTVEIVDEALLEQDTSEAMVAAANTNDWKLLGACTYNMIEKHCYVLAELDWENR
jgi:hypothetical protein